MHARESTTLSLTCPWGSCNGYWHWNKNYDYLQTQQILQTKIHDHFNVHSKLHNINLLNVTPPLTPQNPRVRMFSV
jgi:hypothetical protein